MKNRHRLFPSALALSFLIGCAGEEATAPDAKAPSATSAHTVSEPTTTSVPPAPPIKDEAKAPTPATDQDKAPELTPAPSKDETKDKAAPADDAKKAETKPSLEGPSADAGAVKLLDDEIANIKKLPAGEQPAALAQALCPVSKGHLGEMGTPVKFVAEGRTFYLCCDSCEDDVKKDPKGVIAKLDKLVKK